MKLTLHNHNRLYNFEFEVADSGIIGVYGISGSGKSSLLDALAGYDENAKGSVEHNGKPLSGVIQCAYMNQHPILFEHWTVRENLEFVKSYHSISYDDYCKKLQCYDLLDKYPKQLSGGQRQRIAFIRALIQIHDGTMVLLDEPFSALDKSMRKTALLLLTNFNKSLIFLVTHEINELYQVASEFLFIKEGIIDYQGLIADAMRGRLDELPVASKIVINDTEHIIYADDVSVSFDSNQNSSIQHQIACTIMSIKNNGNIALLKLSLQNSSQTLYAQITQDSLNRLALSVNKRIIANFKALAYHD